ncbi:unnamed protein product [Caenorhabditis auriculariae]|uniref:ZP domain-containing protein n=1 Tax=Caenorhabditis auriculariae TaxID=2777116 RepID=A0A8S1HPJ9_9PELO|nr:unnamed protein product [Caenorhabditis auriculariae]
MLDPRVGFFFCSALVFVSAIDPQIRVHPGHLDISDGLLQPSFPPLGSYAIGQPYTFEIYLEDTVNFDYMIDHCDMDGQEFISAYGCVQCGQCVTKSIETELYNKPGAIKRTLVWFVAKSTQIQFHCQVKKYSCSGCTERSCQRQPVMAMALGSYVSPGPPLILNYPATPVGVIGSAPGAVAGYGRSAWPWWLWLLLLLLLLLLLCCLLALCLAAWFRRRKTTTTTTCVEKEVGKDSQCVGTEKVSVQCVATGTEDDLHKCQPAIVVGGRQEECEKNGRSSHYRSRTRENESSRRHEDCTISGGGGGYSVQEGRIHEKYSRTIPKETHYANNDRFERGHVHGYLDNDDRAYWSDRSSYRNFAYERDMGRVEPLDGFDEIETREKTYCLSDDEQEIVEKEVKRTHSTRFVQETREFESMSDEERYREEEHQHAHYTHSLPV